MSPSRAGLPALAALLWAGLPVVAPLVVLGLALLVFETTNDAFRVGLDAAPANGDEGPNWVLVAAERRARLVWQTSVLLLAVVSLGAVLLSLCLIARSVEGMARRTFYVLLAVAAVIASVTVGHNDISFELMAPHILAPTIGQVLDAGGAHCGLAAPPFTLCDFQVSRALTNSLSFSATLATAFAIAALIFGLSEAADKAAVQQSILRLQTLLYVAAAVLISVVLSMGAWLQWPAALAETPEIKARLLAVATGIGFFWGTAFSLMLAAVYLPAAFRLEWLRRDLGPLQAPAPAEKGKGKSGGGAGGGPVFGQMLRMIAILSPMITGLLPIFNVVAV